MQDNTQIVPLDAPICSDSVAAKADEAGRLLAHNLKLTGKTHEALSALMTLGIINTVMIEKALRHQARRLDELSNIDEDHNPDDPKIETRRGKAAAMRGAAKILRQNVQSPPTGGEEA